MILDRFTAILKTAGVDLVRPFSLEWLGQAAIALPHADFGRRNAMGVVVGNTRALWPCFLEALRNEDSLRHAEHPLDAYVMRSIRDAARQISIETKILWAHDMEPEPIPIQRIAEVAGLAKISPSHLSIHPRFGPWIALRAVLVLDAEGPAGPAPSVPDHCSPCDRPCMSAFRRALEASNTNERDVQRDATVIRRAWRAWLEVRVVCSIGAEHRYGDAQAEYHYAKRLPLISRG